jgi:hypothetical protein
MAYFAKVKNGLVIDIHAVADAAITDSDGNESEALGQALLCDLWGGDPSEYVQCSDDGTRGCYPGIGYSWDGTVFAAPITPDPILPDPSP